MRTYPRRISTLVLTTLTLLAAAGLDGAAAGEWANFRGPNLDNTVAGDGVFDAEGVGLAVDWRRPLGKGYSGIAMVGDRLVTAFSDGEFDHLVALDAGTGGELWRYELDTTYKGHDGSDDGPISTPAVDGGVVYALGPKGQLVAVRLADGSEVWKVDIEEALEAKAPVYGYTTAPLVIGDMLFVQSGGPEGRSFAGLDKRTGEVLWQSGSAAVTYQSPIVATLAGRRQIVAVGNNNVTGLDPASGTVLWSHRYSDQEGESATNPVVIEGDRVLLTTDQHGVLLRVEAVGDGFEINQVWREDTLGGSLATPVYREDHFYGFDGNFLTCVSAETGDKVWKSRPPGGHGLILVDDRLVVYTPDGALVVIKASPEGYEEVARFQADERGGYTWPTFAGGKIFVRNLETISRIGITKGVAEMASAPAPAEVGPPANRFEAFVREVAASDNKRALVDDFMNEQSGFPIVEGEYVHFVYRGDVEDVAISGNMTEYLAEEPLERIEGTNLFHRTYTIEPGARWEYRYNVDFDNVGADLANPRRVPGAQGDFSELITAGYETPAHLRAYRGDTPGRLETFTLKSEILGNEREISVYLPAGYGEDGREYPSVVIPEGEEWLQWGNLPNSLNNLIGNGVAPLVAVFVPNVQQAAQAELGEKSGDYVRMLVEELLPQLEGKYRLAKDPQSRAIMGYAMASTVVGQAALEHPEVFGKAALQSVYLPGANAERLASLASDNEPSGTRFLLYSNRYELRREEWNLDLAADTRRMADALKAAGHDVRAVEVLDAAGWGSWRAHAGDILTAFFPQP